MRIIVLGAGTAGWITALMARAWLGPNVSITVVGSREVGIVGVGEGTTPQFKTYFLDAVGLTFADLVQNAGATIKSSIRFEGWGGQGSYYHHPFADGVTPTLELGLHPPGQRPSHAQVSYVSRAAEQGRVPLTLRPAWLREPGVDPMEHMIQHAISAVHFDAYKLAAFLEKVGRQRGIEVVEDRVVAVNDTIRGDVESLGLASGRVLPCRLVFDCSGFHRMLIGKHYRTAFRDLSGTLRTNRAMPFRMPLDAVVRPVTDAIAMDFGWLWRIPTQDRYGCGYVFDRTFCDDDTARAEVLRRFPQATGLDRAFDFTPGYYERIWHHNVVATGLASQFFEPIEATSIWVTVMTVREFLQDYLAHGDQRARDDFHHWWRTLMDRVVDYLYVHYLTQRTNSPFWTTFRERTTPPPGAARLLGSSGMRWHFEEPPELGGHPAPFSALSWGWLADGVGLWDEAALDRLWRFRGLHEGFADRLAAHEAHIEAFCQGSLTHEQAISYLGGRLQH